LGVRDYGLRYLEAISFLGILTVFYMAFIVLHIAFAKRLPYRRLTDSTLGPLSMSICAWFGIYGFEFKPGENTFSSV
jgi:hypothetical protein